MIKPIIGIFSCWLVLISCQAPAPSASTPKAIAGVLNLTNLDLSAGKPVLLQGEWEFYWGQLLTETDFASLATPKMTGYIAVPATWNDQVVDGKLIGGSGFATYHLRVMLKNPGVPLAIKPGTILTAYRLFVNGSLISHRGSVARSAEAGKPLLLADTAAYNGTENQLDLVLQVSNFHHRNGGPWDNITLGTLSAMVATDRTTREIDFLILGAILVMGLFFFILFALRSHDQSYLYFSLFCLLIALRMSLQNGVGYLNQALPGLEWELINKIEYLTLYLALPVFLLFMKEFFRDHPLTLAFRAVSVISAACIAFTLATTSLLHSWLIPIYQVVLVVTGVFVLGVIIWHSLKKDRFARLMLAAIVVLFVAAINDILNSDGVITTIPLIPYGLLTFIVFQASVLALRLIEVFNAVDRQQRQLMKTNMEFQEELDKRIEMEEFLKDSNEHLMMARSAIILGLAKIAEYRDTDTGTHLVRIQEYDRILARQLQKHPDYANYITEDYINDLYDSSILHDIGKVGIPDSILLKPGKLTTEEFEIIKKHPTIGGDTVKSIEKNIHVQTFLTLGREIAYMHHEKWDGSGYPNGLAGTSIPLSARITAVADVYDALTTKRSYKEAFSHEKARDIITADRGKHFDPDIVDAFLAVEAEFVHIRSILPDEAIDTSPLPSVP